MTNNVFEDSFPEKPFKPNKAYFKDLASTVYKDLASTPESENTSVSWKRNVFDGNDANLAVTYVREASLEELSKVSVMTPEDFQEKFLDAFEKLVKDPRFELVKDSCGVITPFDSDEHQWVLQLAFTVNLGGKHGEKSAD